MAGRHAILIANSVSYGIRSKDVPPVVVRQIVREMSDRLQNLGELSFRVTPVLDRTRDEASKSIRESIKKAGSQEQDLLLYYFGHAVPDSDERLFLYFNDSEWPDLPTMLRFGEITEWLTHYRVPRVFIVLDCCYAGAAGADLNALLRSYRNQYFLMGSVNSRDKAQVDYNERPFGQFSKFLLDSFSDSRAREPHSRNVTCKTLFSFVRDAMNASARLKPVSMDGGLADEIMFIQSTDLVIAAGVREAPAKKALYRKLFAIARILLHATEFADDSKFYAFVKKRRPVELDTPVKAGPRTVGYEIVKQETFRHYLTLARDLGIVERESSVRLTPRGKRMIRNDGRVYNAELFECIKALWQGFGIEIVDFEDAVSTRIRGNRIPSSPLIYRDLYLTRKISMPRQLFEMLLGLTADVGALQDSRDRTFFPVGSQEQ